jgi:hypothetical protein
MKTSKPPSYDNINDIVVNSSTVVSDTTSGGRALLYTQAQGSGAAGRTVTINVTLKDDTTTDIILPITASSLGPLTTILLPLSVKNVNTISNSAGTATSYLSLLT